ncbi:MAG TPA: DUF5924 family protein [Thermoanaerobaculia bacterium]|nr:DUF5924 family protein [Thermoanaerobaculia bacterium]
MTWRELHARYGRVLWALHSAWALLSGIVVLVLAHNRYGFLRGAIVFIALTWASTLFFPRTVDAASPAGRVAQNVVSYLTRVMYQETLFFLLPFYFYSATVLSWNFLYVIALAAFAVLSCFDELFDRLLGDYRWFAIGFFAFVSFSGLQLFIPLVLRMHVDIGELIAAAISFIGAIVLAGRWRDFRNARRLAAAAVAFAATLAVVAFGALLPPVPLRLTRLAFAGALNPRTLNTSTQFQGEIPRSELRRGRVYAIATVFSPERIPAQMQIRFISGGNVVRESRLVDLTARPDGFRVWDSVHAGDTDAPQTFRVEVWTGRQLLGRRSIRVTR